MRIFVTCLLTLFLSAGMAMAGGSFHVVSQGSSTAVFDVTPDGTWAAGTDNGQAFRWSEATGIELLSPSEWQWTHTIGISDDGTQIASSVQYGDTDPRVFGPARWTEGMGWEELDTLYVDPPYTDGTDWTFGSGYDISGDGSMVVGLAWHPGYKASGFTWTEAGGIVDLGRPSPDFGSSRASAVSADGSTVVGFWEDENFGNRRPVRWVDGGAFDLFLGADTWGEANGASSDGSLITGAVGFNDDPGYGWSIGFLYSDDGGYVDMGILPGSDPWNDRSMGMAVSDTGIVVGWSGATGPWGIQEPIVWTEAGGMVRITDYLAEQEVEIPDNIVLTSCLTISADGYAIGGQGYTTDTYEYVGWLVKIVPPVYTFDVVVTGEVEYNQVNDGLFADVTAGDPVTIKFQVISDQFTDSTTYNTRGYWIDLASYSMTIGSASVGLLDPYPAGNTPYFVLRNNDPVSDGFFVADNNVDWPWPALPLDEPGIFGPFGTHFEVGYEGETLESLDIMDAVGIYDYTGLTSFYMTLDDGGMDAMGLIFTEMEISQFFPFEVNIDCTTPTLTLPDMGGFDVSAVNNTNDLMQVQGALNVTLCYGNTINNIRRGTTNLQGGETFTQSWMMNIPRYNSTCNCDLVWTLVGTDLATESEMEDSCIITTSCDF